MLSSYTGVTSPRFVSRKFIALTLTSCGMPLSDEATIERLFLDAQSVSRCLDKFDEMLRAPHEHAEFWKKRLEELGERLV